MNRYVRDLQILAGVGSVIVAVLLVLAIRSPMHEPDWFHAIFDSFLATLLALGTWFAAGGQSAAIRANLRAAWRGGLLVGGVAFALGYIGPVLVHPDANQGPLLGIFFTGPAGFVVGVVAGLVWRLWTRTRRPDVTAPLE